MFPRRQYAARRAQAGFSLPVVVGVIVLAAVLGAAMVNLVATGQQSVALEVVSTRAFYAAESGAQFGMQRLFPPSGAAASCANANVAFDTNGLSGCNATISCTSTGPVNGTMFYTITSSGRCSSGPTQATRTIQVKARSL
jgi:MSHA biogenesis protein MshP